MYKIQLAQNWNRFASKWQSIRFRFGFGTGESNWNAIVSQKKNNFWVLIYIEFHQFGVETQSMGLVSSPQRAM